MNPGPKVLMLGLMVGGTSAAAAVESALPRVVLLGDSIRMGYQAHVTAALAGIAQVEAPDENCRHSGEVRRHLQAWAMAKRPRLVHLNAGLHEIYRNPGGERQLTVEQYTANLDAIFGLLTEAGIPVIWSTTTPVIDEWYHRAKGYACRVDRDVAAYNQAAAVVLERHRVPVLDLYGVVMALPQAEREALYNSDGVHFNGNGSRLLGERIAAFIRGQLAALDQAAMAPPRAFRYLYNFEMILLCNLSPITRERAQSYLAKLEGTDVDAVMCCPQAWRASLWPSAVDPTWKTFSGKPPHYPYEGFAYLKAGGDPVRDLLDATRAQGKGFFLSYRMNDFHWVESRYSPTHPDFWRQHPEYWLGDSDLNAYGCQDNRRLHNYAIRAVRDYYYAILEELATRYDVDGLELDFMRCLRYFHDAEIDAGRPLMTDFVARVRTMLNALGRERGKRLLLCVRLPPLPRMAQAAGLDISAWTERNLIDMITVAPQFIHSMELDIEGYRALSDTVRVHGELNFLVAMAQEPNSQVQHHRLTNFPTYRASAFNLLSRGADGISIFNFDYARAKDRSNYPAVLRGLADLEFLRTADKCYAIYRSHAGSSLPAYDEAALELVVPDDPRITPFGDALLRVETQEPLAGQRLTATVNGRPLAAVTRAEPELFPPLAQGPAYAKPECLRFFRVPLGALAPGRNRIELRNLDRDAASCRFWSLELALYREPPAP